MYGDENINADKESTPDLYALMRLMQEELSLYRTREEAMMSLLKKSSVAGTSIPPDFDHLSSFDQHAQPKYVVADECDGTGSTANANSSPHHHETAQTTSRGGGLRKETLLTEEDQQCALGLSCEDEYRSYRPGVDNHGVPYSTRDHHVHNALGSMLHQTHSFMSSPVSYLPQLQLQKFSGDIEHHPKFVQGFKAFVKLQCYDYHRGPLYLQIYLDGELSKLVQNGSAYPVKSVGYYQA